MEFLRHNRFVFHFFMGIALAVVYPMHELFSGNQNIYFLWGTADLLPNAFTADPLLNSPDPYPLFSWLISIFPVQLLGVWTTILYISLNFVYSFALFGIADRLAPLYNNRKQLLSFSALFLFLHSAPIWGTYFQLMLDVDLRWMWDSGIAEQGVLRGYLQPSVFGVFLLLSLYFASRRNYVAAILCIAPAATLHASYLFLGGLLTIIYLVQSNFEKKNLLAATVLLLMVLPYSYYVFNHFVQLDESVKTIVNDAVLAGFEENIHLNPTNWLNAKFYLQLAIMLAGAAAMWYTRLRGLILALFGFGIMLSLLAFGLDNTTLLSLNPWRISVLIMPISAVAILSQIVQNGVWKVLRPHIFSSILVISSALIVYRVLGNPSDAFLNTWKMVQIAAFILVLLSAGFIFKNEWIKKLLVPSVFLALLLVGEADRYVHNLTRSNTEQFKVITAISKEYEPNTVYIIPPEWTSFRMNAQKAVFSDKNLVYGPALPSLMDRLELISDVTENQDYRLILEAIPDDLQVKLITTSSSHFEENKERITDAYSCVTLR